MGNWKTFCFEHIEDNKYTLLCKKSIKVFFSYCFSETEAKILKRDIEGILAAKRKSKFWNFYFRHFIWDRDYLKTDSLMSNFIVKHISSYDEKNRPLS